MSTVAQQIQSAALCRDMCRRLQICNYDERRVLDKVMQRLELGRDRYGHLDLSAPRDWRKERFEERLDALVYDVAEELAAEDVARAAMREDARTEMLGQAADREIARWSVDQRTRVSTEPAIIAFRDIAEREPYVDFDLDDQEIG